MEPNYQYWAPDSCLAREAALSGGDCLPVSFPLPQFLQAPASLPHTHSLWLRVVCEAPLPSFSQVTVTGTIARLTLSYYISSNRTAPQGFWLLEQE